MYGFYEWILFQLNWIDSVECAKMEDIKEKKTYVQTNKNDNTMTLTVKYFNIILSRFWAVFLKFKFVKLVTNEK